MSHTRQCISPPCGDSENPETKPTAYPTSRGDVNVSPVSVGNPQADGSLAQTTVVGDNGLPAYTGGQPQASPTATTQPVFTEPPVAVANGSKGGGGNGLSTGAVAGIAVATLILGALIAFLIAFLLFRRTRRNEPQPPRALPSTYTNYSDSMPELVMIQQQKALGRNSPYVQVSQHQTPLPAPTPTPAPPHHADTALAFLPAPASDADVTTRVTAVFAAVARHVETYYRNVQASITPSMESELARYGARGVDMVELMGRVGEPTTAITHALAVYVASITGPKQQADENKSGVSVFPEALESAGYLGGHEIESDTSPHATALSLHRRIAVYLHTSSPSSFPSSSPSPRSPSSQSYSHTHNHHHTTTSSSVREAAESFSLTFFPWANPAADDEAKDDELAGIIAQALDVQLWLFGQPGRWGLRFEGVGGRGVGVVPEVVEGERRVGEGRVVAV